MDLNTYLMIWVCIFGLCLGSFYNVVILRSLSGESIIFPGSKCPKCNQKLYWWHNIPVLSYILLGGKCYFCKEKISIQYPVVELVSMVIFGISYVKFGISYTTLFVIFWLSCLLIMTVTDLKEKVADCSLAIAVGISGIIFSLLQGGLNGALYSVLGIIAGILIMELVARSGYIIAGKRAMGEADSYIAGALGGIAGIFSIPKILLISLFVSMFFVIPIFLYNKYRSGDKAVCICAILFTLSVLVFHTLSQNLLTFSALLLTGIVLLVFILKGIKQTENHIYLPYIPALSISALYYIFTIM